MNMVDAINIIAKMAGTTVARRNIGGFVAAAGAERVAVGASRVIAAAVAQRLRGVPMSP